MAILLPFLTEEVLNIFPTRGIGRHLVVGVVFAVTPVVEAIVAPLVAADLQYVGAKNVLVLSSLMVSGALLLFGFINKIKSWSAFITLAISIRIVQGIGSGANFTSAYALFVTTFPESSGQVNGVIRGLNGFGYMAGPALGGFLYDVGGFGLPFFIMASFLVTTSFVNMILLIANGKDGPATTGQKQQPEKNAVTFKAILSFPWVWMSLMVLALAVAMGGVLESTISQYMKDSFGTSSTQGGLAIMVYAAGYASASFLSGYTLERWIGPRRMCLYRLTLSVISFLLYGPASILPLKPSLALVFISTVPTAISGAAMLTAVPEDMLRTLGHDAVGEVADVSAYIGAINQVGLSLFYMPGVLLGPVLSASIGLRKLSTIAAAAYLSLTLVYLVGYLRKCRSEKRQQELATHHSDSHDCVTGAGEQAETIPLVTANSTPISNNIAESDTSN